MTTTDDHVRSPAPAPDELAGRLVADLEVPAEATPVLDGLVELAAGRR